VVNRKIFSGSELARPLKGVWGDNIQDERKGWIVLTNNFNLCPLPPPYGVGIPGTVWVQLEQAERVAAFYPPGDEDKLANGLVVKVKFISGAYEIRRIAARETHHALGGSPLPSNPAWWQHGHTDEEDGGPLGENSVTDFQIAPEAVGTSELKPAAVTNSILALLSVATGNLIDGLITNIKMAVNSVTTSNIVDSAVTAIKLAANSVTTVKILDQNVTTPKIADLAVTPAKIEPSPTNGDVMTTVDGETAWAPNSGGGLESVAPTDLDGFTPGDTGVVLVGDDTSFVVTSNIALDYLTVNYNLDVGGDITATSVGAGLVTSTTGDFTDVYGDAITANVSLSLPNVAPTADGRIAYHDDVVKIGIRSHDPSLNVRWYGQGGTTSVTNTATETVLYSGTIETFPANSLNDATTIWVEAEGTLVNNQGTARTWNFKLYFGGQVYTVACTVPTGTHVWDARLKINIGSLGSGSGVGSGDAAFGGRIFIDTTPYGQYQGRATVNTTGVLGVGIASSFGTYVGGTTLQVNVHHLSIDVHN
jgi:hypothetical protein